MSESSVALYLDCPQGYKLRHRDGHPERPSPVRNLAAAIRAALETFFRGRLHGPPPLANLLDVFDQSFDDEAYATFDEREDAYADGTLIIQTFYEKHAPSFRPALAVAQELNVDVEGMQVRAVLDRLDKLDDGRVRIVEYELDELPTRDLADHAPRFALCQLAVEHQLGVEVEGIELYHLPSHTTVVVPRRSDDQIRDAKARVLGVLRGIGSGDFEPRTQPRCRVCDSRRHCTLFADWYESDEDRTGAPGVPSRDEAEALADEFCRLADEIRSRRAELSSVRETLERYFDATGDRAISGRRVRLTARRVVTPTFRDLAALREVLEPFGLWDPLLQPAPRRASRLLTDPDVSSEVRARLESLAEERVRWRLSTAPLPSD